MKSYIGDGVYAETDDLGEIVLTTENGIAVTNRIVFDGPTLVSLLNWLQANTNVTYSLKEQHEHIQPQKSGS